MRVSTVLFLAALLVGCGDDDDDDDDDTSDSAGGGGDSGGGGGSDAPPAPQNGFQIVTPDIVLQPGEEKTFCYYTTLSNAEAQGVKRWQSSMTPGSHHLILFFTNQAGQPDGTLTEDCGFASSIDNLPIWAYSASDPEVDFEMPEGVGMAIKANQPLFVQMHYLNTDDDTPLTARVVVNGETYAQGEPYQQAHAFVTYNTEIDVPPQSTGEVSGSCAVPEGINFFTMSTHAHRFMTRATVSDQGTMIVDTTDWEHPDLQRWQSEPFYTFSGNLDYHCEYYNGTNNPVQTGDSARTDEMCMAVGYFFPAEKPVLCVNSFVVPF